MSELHNRIVQIFLMMFTVPKHYLKILAVLKYAVIVQRVIQLIALVYGHMLHYVKPAIFIVQAFIQFTMICTAYLMLPVLFINLF